MRRWMVLFAWMLAAPPALVPSALGQQDGVVKLNAIEVDTKSKLVRIECTAVAPDMPLEFFLVSRNGPDHETVLKTDARPSDVHAALLMIGLEPGSPVRPDPAGKGWLAPHGPPLRMRASWTSADGKQIDEPAERLIRSIETKQPMPPIVFVFTGSKINDRNEYVADLTGYVASIVNFELTPIDVPRLASSDNATLEWEYNVDVAPPRGTNVVLTIEPMRNAVVEEQSSNDADFDLSIAELRDRWRAAVKPHADALREAAQTHYQVIGELKRRQQALLDEADKLQRLIEQLEREYQAMSTPRPPETPN